MKLKANVIAEFANNSNWIEGIETSFSQIEFYAEQEDKNDKEGFSPYVTNHVEAVNYVEDNYKRTPSIEDIINLHSILLDGIDDRIGSLRNDGVSIVARIQNPDFFMHLYHNDFDPRTAPPLYLTKVLRECPSHKALKRMLRSWINIWDKTLGDEDKDCLYRHYEFEHIHPFFDGNGRTGRLLYLWDQLNKGLDLKIITNQGKHENYYKKIENYIDKERKHLSKRWV